MAVSPGLPLSLSELGRYYWMESGERFVARGGCCFRFSLPPFPSSLRSCILNSV